MTRNLTRPDPVFYESGGEAAVVNTSVKSDLHRLIDELDEAEASRLLQLVADPLGRSLFLAPVDDEPVTEADLAAIKDAEAAYQRGEWVADEDLTL